MVLHLCVQLPWTPFPILRNGAGPRPFSWFYASGSIIGTNFPISNSHEDFLSLAYIYIFVCHRRYNCYTTGNTRLVVLYAA